MSTFRFYFWAGELKVKDSLLRRERMEKEIFKAGSWLFTSAVCFGINFAFT